MREGEAMSSPQTENGYSKIANEILEQIYRLKLNGSQFRIILVIWRFTYGFSRKEHELSEGYIAKAAGINRKQVSRELRGLIDYKIVTVISESTPTTSRVIAFNKNYDTWELISRQGANQWTGNGLVDLGGSELAPQEKKVLKKDINTPAGRIKNDLFDLFWKTYPRRVSKAAAQKVFNKLKVDGTLLTAMLSALEIQKQSKQWQDKQFIPHPTTWLNQRRWEDETEGSNKNENAMKMLSDGSFKLE